MTRRVALLGLCLLWSGCNGCNGCGQKHLARLTAHEGGVDRDFAAEQEKWLQAQDGATFDEGDGLRTGPEGSAKVLVTGAGKVQLQSQTLVRFFASGRPAGSGQAPAGVEVQEGEAVIDAVEAEVPLKTRTGVAVVGRGSRVSVQEGERGMRYAVEMGSATFVSPEGTPIPVEAGQSIEVGIGLAEITDAPVEVADAPTEAAPAVADAGAAGVSATVRGPVRGRTTPEGSWTPLQAGEQRVSGGTELEVGEGGQVALSRGGQRAVLGEGRYEVGEDEGALVRAADGALSISADGEDARLQVPGGVIIVRGADGGSSADVTVRGADGQTEVSAERGTVDTEGPAGAHNLSSGESALLSLQADAGVDAEGQDGQEAWQPGLSRADLVVPAGESFQVLDPGPPTAIGFDRGARCPEGAELRVGKQRLRAADGAAHVIASLAVGAYSYQLHCLRADGAAQRRPTRRGRVRVLRSRGTRKLATSAPKNTVTLDGRRYTLMYQGRLPVVTAVWPRAPKADSYALYVRGPGGNTKTYKSAEPALQLPAGALKDGTHRAYFTAVGSGGKRSRETTLAVTFDNAAPTASVGDPPPAGYARGAEVSVSGLALPGTRVSVSGQRIALDRQQRFSGSVPAPAGDGTLAIRFQHRKHGVRYFLRRVRGPAP